jgi:hypothetical protein
MDGLLDRRDAPAATEDQIERVHRPDYGQPDGEHPVTGYYPSTPTRP